MVRLDALYIFEGYFLDTRASRRSILPPVSFVRVLACRIVALTLRCIGALMVGSLYVGVRTANINSPI